MSDEEQFEYHADDLDLVGEDLADWSIRCLDVHKRLGGVPVLDGLNVAVWAFLAGGIYGAVGYSNFRGNVGGQATSGVRQAIVGSADGTHQRGRSSQRTTFAHWFRSRGRSR